MSILNDYKIYIALYVFLNIIYNQYYKISTKNMVSSASLTILLELIASIVCLFFIPLFDFKLPSNIYTYIFLFLATIFYTLNNRLSTVSRSRLDASTYMIIKQIPAVVMIITGILLFKENIIFNKILGAFIIIFSNILVFYNKRKIKIDKYVLIGILSNIFLSIGMIIDVSYSDEFNLPLYVLITMFIPAVITLLFERVKIKNIIYEYKCVDKMSLYLTSFCSSIMMISKLIAYNLGDLTLVAPLSSLSVILSVITGYLFFNEKENIFKKVIASILIIIGVILINL